MDYESQLTLQSYLDGELPEAKAREVANWLAKDQEAVALLAELRNTREALVGFEAGMALPESREFFWSKVQREIRAQQPAQPEPTSQAAPLLARLRRFLIPAGAVAALACVVLVSLNSGGVTGSALEATSADSGSFTYHDYPNQTTLVWLSYPADKEVAEQDAADIVP